MSFHVHLKKNVEHALEACGRDRAFSRTGTPTPGIAIRFDGIRVEQPTDAKPFIVGEGETFSEAGAIAARAFAKRLLDASQNLKAWADRITAALEGPE
jgi:hypothetical protein